MKTILKISTYLILLLFFSINYSCKDDFFDEKAGEKITPEQHFKSEIDLEMSMYGCFVPLQKASANLILLDGLRTELMETTENADLYMKAINNQVFEVGNPYLDPSDYYKSIININEVLQNIDKIKDIDPNFDEFIAHQYKGALITLRAWNYFTVARLYNQVKIYNDNVTTVNLNDNSIKTKAEVVPYLIDELKPYVFNRTDMPELYFGNFPNTKELIGELYLEINNYDSAATYLKMSMESMELQLGKAAYKVTKAFKEENWRTIFIGAENNGIENIMTIPFLYTEGQANPVTMWTAGDYKVRPTQILVDSFNNQIVQKTKKPSDINRGFGVTFDTIPGASNKYFIKKYALDNGEPLSTDIVLSRAAQVHLLLAEALNRKSEPQSDISYLLVNDGINSAKKKPAGYLLWNTTNVGIRGRVGLANRTIPAGLSGEAYTNAIEDMIMDERALELAFEGSRWFDLVRVAERRGPEYLANKVSSKFTDPVQREKIRTFLMDKNNWYLPSK